MRTRVRVFQGRLAEVEPHRTSAIDAAYKHFRLDKQGSLVSPKTQRSYGISSGWRANSKVIPRLAW